MAPTDNPLNASVPRQRTIVLAAVFVMLASSLGAQDSNRRSASDVHMRIETDRTTYRVGEPIKVRLTLHNTSPSSVQFWAALPALPAAYVGLTVTDESDRPLEKDYRVGGGQSGSGRLKEIELKGGEKWTLSYKGSEWMNLQDWNYKISTPGRYVLTGVPYFFIPNVTPDKTVRSNEATFSIEP